jgi:hypothetical protein
MLGDDPRSRPLSFNDPNEWSIYLTDGRIKSMATYAKLGTKFAVAALALRGVCAAADVQVGSLSPSLPFLITVTEEKFDPLPEYMSGRNPVGMDYPYCPVMIDGEFWVMHKNGYDEPVFRYKGTTIENAVRQPDGKADLPRGAYILGGLWYDASEKKLYAPLHYEVHDLAPTILREIHLATSTDKGLTWKYEGAIITSNGPKRPRKAAAEYSGDYYDGGDGDHLIYVDERGGYIYVFTDHYTWPKAGDSDARFLRHCVARCAIADKMAPGKWWKFYEGAWNQPGIGGKASYVNGYCVTYNSYLKKYVSFNYLSGVSFCDDLSRQEWSPSLRLGRLWGCDNGYWAFWPTSQEMNDTAHSGQNLYVYSFFERNPGRRFRISLDQGETKPDLGLTPSSVWFYNENTPHQIITMDSGPMYGYTPFVESSDAIEARRTRRVGCLGAEVKYSGTWSAATDPSYYEGKAKSSAESRASVEITFQGKEIYWRAVKGPDLGKADVFLDGVLQTTVDCWASLPTCYQFAFIKRGLSGEGPHTIKVVVKNKKNPLSSGTAIQHMLFEISAEN